MTPDDYDIFESEGAAHADRYDPPPISTFESFSLCILQRLVPTCSACVCPAYDRLLTTTTCLDKNGRHAPFWFYQNFRIALFYERIKSLWLIKNRIYPSFSFFRFSAIRARRTFHPALAYLTKCRTFSNDSSSTYRLPFGRRAFNYY